MLGRSLARSSCTLVVAAALLCGCGPRMYRELRIRTSPFASAVANGAPLAADKLEQARAERVVLEDDATSLWEHARRVLVARLGAAPPKEVSLDDGAHRVTTVDPDHAGTDAMTALWVVDVVRNGVVFALAPTTLDALEAVSTRAVADPGVRFLVRGQDRATFGDVLRVLGVLERVAPGRSFLGAFTSTTTPATPWTMCFLPEGKERETAKVRLLLDVRDDGRVGVVHLVRPAADAEERAFGTAAALCAAHQDLTAHAGERGYRLRMNFTPR